MRSMALHWKWLAQQRLRLLLPAQSAQLRLLPSAEGLPLELSGAQPAALPRRSADPWSKHPSADPRWSPMLPHGAEAR